MNGHRLALKCLSNTWLVRLVFAAMANLLVFVGGCSQASKGSPQQKNEETRKGDRTEANQSVTVIKPKRMNMQWTCQGPGYIQAFEQTPMFAKIAGYVKKWHVDIGDHVQKGQTLAELWIPEMEVELKQKDALVVQATAELKLAKESVIAADAEHRRLKSQHERLARISGTSGTINKDEVEEARLGAEASAAKRNMAEAEVGVKQALLEVAKQNREHVKTLLDYANLKAPFEGIVTRRNINTDDFVQPPTAGKGEPLYVVERQDTMRVFIPVAEADAPWVGKGAAARVRIQALAGQEFNGNVARTSYSLDRAARTLLAEIDLLNPDDRLRPNMYAFAVINLEQQNAMTLPDSAIVTQGEVTKGFDAFCWIFEEGQLRRTLVQTGNRAGGRIQVLKKQEPAAGTARWIDFTGNELIVQETSPSFFDGQKVTASKQ
jgi:RND family efflux transporter MFP subunit